MTYTLPSQGLHARPCTYVDTNYHPVLTAQTETILDMRRELLRGPTHSVPNRFVTLSCEPCSPQYCGGQNSSRNYDGLVTNQNRPLSYPFIHAGIHPGELPVSAVIANSQSTHGFSSGIDYRRAASRNCSRW